MVSSVLEITMETFDTISTLKKFIRYAAHPMLAISFENSKRIMLVTCVVCVVCVCVCVCVFVCVCVCLYSSTVEAFSVCKMSETYLKAQINDLVL